MIKVALVDTTYLCHVALHSTGMLRNGTLYGVLGLLAELHDRFDDHRFVYCFDSPKSLRKVIYPAYKGNRKPQPEQERLDFNRQRNELQHKILPKLDGAVVCVDGYEGDDVIAALAQRRDWAVTIVSNDEDLYQLLSPRVRQWNRKTMTTYKAWVARSGVQPSQWPMVKAIAGCPSDNIKGIELVGPKRAVEYLQGTLSEKFVTVIRSAAGQSLIRRNLDLVTLPFKGMPDLLIEPSPQPNLSKWNRVMARYGMQSRAKGVR